MISSGLFFSSLIAFFLHPQLFTYLADVLNFKRIVIAAIILFVGMLLLAFISRKRKGLSILVFALGLTLLWSMGMLGIENKWKKDGIQPGVLNDSMAEFYNYPDTLIDDSLFIADENGIMKANRAKWDHSVNVWAQENGYQINREGFRSREFVKDTISDTCKGSVLFLGDSFTWGSTAEPIELCFVDLIEAAGYKTYNSGIGGTDPLQYWLVAQKYLPQIMPDQCFLMFCLGNDQMRNDREPIPYMPLYFSSNAGGINAYSYSCIDGVWQDMEPLYSLDSAWNYHLGLHTLLGKNRNWFKKFCANTVLGTKIWKLFNGCKTCSECKVPEEDFSANYIGQIESLCKKLEIPFQVFLIPNSDNPKKDFHMYRNPDFLLYDRFSVKIPEMESEDFHHNGDFHFNNQGHKTYADFVLKYLE